MKRWFFEELARAVVTVPLARRRRGPLRPSWSARFEILIAAQKRFSARVARLPLTGQRAAWASLKGPTPTLKRARVARTTVGGVPSLWIAPAGVPDGAPVILYFHGGSFAYGSEASHGEQCARIAEAARARLLMPFYRLAPEHAFPAALEDALAVHRALRNDGIAASRLVVAGDSAGGNLTVALLQALRDAGEELPAAGVPICAWLDMTAHGGSLDANEPFDWGEPWMFDVWADAYVPRGQRADSRVSPGLGDAHGLPPLLVLVGDAEMLFDQVMAFVDKARSAGVEVETHVGTDMVHEWIALAPMFASCQGAIDVIGEFVGLNVDHRRGS